MKNAFQGKALQVRQEGLTANLMVLYYGLGGFFFFSLRGSLELRLR